MTKSTTFILFYIYFKPTHLTSCFPIQKICIFFNPKLLLNYMLLTYRKTECVIKILEPYSREILEVSLYLSRTCSLTDLVKKDWFHI